MNVYADTSFLVSLYSPDANSARAAAKIGRLNPTVFRTPLHEVELSNALELRVFRQELDTSAVKSAQARLRGHVDEGFFSLQPLPITVYERARQISRRRSAKLGTRTLDILHVASALLLPAEGFLSFDRRQIRLAKVEGLKIR